MENYVRDNLKSGEGNLANREYGKNLMLPNFDHLCRHQKQIEYHHTGICVDSKKEFKRPIFL